MMLFFFLAFTLSNCRSKDDDPEPPIVYPVEEGSVQKVSAGKTFTTFNTEHETGVKFKSAYKGKITKIGVNTASTGNMEVTLWKISDQSKIGTYMINSTSTTNYSFSDQNISIEANTEYLISVHAAPSYLFYTQATTIFPYTNGSITLIDYYFNVDTSHNFPVTTVNTNASSLFGMVDFNFQRTD